ncbi:hypothetical protein A2690_03095 [Candidatus Roizmanbacteria bacterium RIFCSPHIGHO2_01_FULL_39_12b]|uniref:BioF2-like acetyltransferase domain-containing protein n=1 Tax=Candidatus Roizmanbacteria bacterium RIFCSPHIGHO2_01_FULL_39_12b TaxID=1802030 RepID=A0A1F7G972_9BACT|nr:MAG: hypothetical protein A2690_03095 [Candidatus Roizmanbacteria bacterium RIFCSPHIGHO2_01_FULL_39_12b]OGK45967.1 MAG: hypothetical protein A3B46_00205 [Candidatus Roizmanbacteria bacterium RIFCSPLOWO2_01_FULL_39_19]
MTIKLVYDVKLKNEWSRVAPHPLQSWQWGEARGVHGVDVVRIAVQENRKIKSVFQITFHKIPFTPYTIGYLPRSKIFNVQVLKFIQQLAVAKKAIFIKFEPYEEKNINNMKKIDELLETRTVRLSPHQLFPNWTQVINLNRTEEELFNECKPKTRYNIKLAKKKGVIVTEATNESGFNKFIKLYFETCKRQKYHGHTKTYHQILFNTFCNDIAHILVASYNNKPISAYELFLFNGILYYPYGGSSTQYRNLMASNLIMWESILFGIKNRANKFDLWGTLPPGNIQTNDTWAGFSRFKEGYGSKYVEFVGSYDIILDPGLYHLYNTAHIIRKFLMRFI